MTRSGGALIWVVAGVVLLTGMALLLRSMPGQITIETVGALAFGVCFVGGITALSLYGAKRHREGEARAVERVDSALRVLAQQTGHSFVEGGGYAHPMVGFIPYSGRVVGAVGRQRVQLFVTDDEGSFELTVSVTPVPGKKRRLESASVGLSPMAASLVATLQGVCDVIAVESTVPWSFGVKREASNDDFELVCRACAKLEELLTLERLRFTLDNALALARALSSPRA